MATSGNPAYFGRPNWTYVSVVRGPVRGPQPRLAQGTGRTNNKSAAPGTEPQLPSYMHDYDYRPVPFSYQPPNRQSFPQQIPRTIDVGTNGRDLVGTYQPHDFTPAVRNFSHMRSAANWQLQAFLPDFRNTLEWQQVQVYRPRSNTRSAMPLSSSQYFLGYAVTPEIGSQIGQNILGYMGSQ